MSISTRNRRFSYLAGLVIAGLIGGAALIMPTAPAKAQGFVGFQLGPFGFGFGSPGYYAYPYYPYPYNYYYPGYYYPGYYYRW